MENKENKGSKKSKGIGIVTVASWVVGFVISFTVVTAIINTSKISEEPTPRLQTRPLTIVKEDYLPESYKIAFVMECTDGDVSIYDYCACTYNYLDRNYTNAEFMKIADEADRTGEITDEMWEAVGACIDSYNY